ncbi:MAG: hypothetical protein E7214_04640 [Clostridium sp.]|nr:hypothetical protein [Clostridium sp.]
MEISTQKTIIEEILFIISIILIVVITVFYAKDILHYIVGTLGIIFIILQFVKQGISEEGIMVIARGKDMYSWREIYRI